MKKIVFLAALSLAVLSGCVDGIENPSPGVVAKGDVSFTAEEFVYQDGTRATYSPRDNGYQFSWSEGDTLGVYGKGKNQVEFPIGADASGNTVSFDGGYWRLRPESTYVAYYPYAYENFNSVTISGCNVTTQEGNGNTKHLSKHDIMASEYVEADAVGKADFQMKHLTSLLQFDVKAPKAGAYTKLEIKCGNHKFYSRYKLTLSEKGNSLAPDECSSYTECYIVNLVDVVASSRSEMITVYALLPADGYATTGMTATLYAADGRVYEYKKLALYDGTPIDIVNVKEDNSPAWEAGKAYRYCMFTTRFTDEDGHEIVDLGLRDKNGEPVYFSSVNIGAEKPEDYGLYFAWGETEGFATPAERAYNLETYKYYDKTSKQYTKYLNSGEVLSPEDDAAHVNWGRNWRMPTAEEIEPLTTLVLENGASTRICDWTYVEDKKGFNCTSKVTGETIFFPLPGGNGDGSIIFKDDHGFYWTSTCYGDSFSNGSNGSGRTLTLGGNANVQGLQSLHRAYGLPIRPIYHEWKEASSLSLETKKTLVLLGETTEIKATLLPEDAFYPLRWTSSDKTIATVSQTGEVTGVSCGIVTITAETIDGSNLSATCTVAVVDYADFGMKDEDGDPIYWATCNIGARSPEDVGQYFAWGETVGHYSDEGHTFNWKNYQLCNGASNKMKKYVTNPNYGTVDNLFVLEPEDDAAHVNWGEGWRIPTEEEVQDLYFNHIKSSIEWVTKQDVLGLELTSRSGDVKIFLPASTAYYEYGSYYNGICVPMWTRALSYTSSYVDPQKALSGNNSKALPVLFKQVGGFDASGTEDRCIGLPIRPVYNPKSKK